MSVLLRWWWVRHAPIAEAGGRWIGRTDAGCGTIDAARAAALAKVLPPKAVWLTSGYRRTRETAAALRAHLPESPEPGVEPGFAEQDFGAWDGQRYDDLGRTAGEGYWRFWDRPATARPPGGESFAEVLVRVAAAIDATIDAALDATLDDWGRRHRAEDVDLVVVAHAGTIRAALAAALDLPAERALSFEVAPLSLTRIDYRHSHPDRSGEIRAGGLLCQSRQIISSNRTFP